MNANLIEADELTTKQVRTGTGGSPALHLVSFNGQLVGLLEKYRDTRTEKHPWKAFAGYGVKARYLGAFYPNEGGRLAALKAITDADWGGA